VALAVRDFVRSYLELDEFGVASPNLSYPVHSIYLDSPDLILYQNTINGDRNRFKLRLRFYEGGESPIFLEIKRRMNNTIHKQRVAVRREAVEDLIAGYLPEPVHLVRDTPEALHALETFTGLVHQLNAIPQSHVCYQREAWVDAGVSSVRVTFDRDVKSEPRHTLSFEPWTTDPVLIFGNAVVLELKFTARFPNWFNELVQTFGLRQGSAAKYVDGIGRLNERGLVYLGY
jgi:hypothetical protein